MVSSEMEEVIGMSDRIAVMHERSLLAGILDKTECTEKNVMALMTGRDKSAGVIVYWVLLIVDLAGAHRVRIKSTINNHE